MVVGIYAATRGIPGDEPAHVAGAETPAEGART
jgi:hypothetical protein